MKAKTTKKGTKSPAKKTTPQDATAAARAEGVNLRKLYTDGLAEAVRLREEGEAEDAKSERDTARTFACNFIESCLAKYSEAPEVKRALESWGKGEIAGYTEDNPLRLACQAAFYSISAGADFRAETAANWKKSGFAVNEDARPFFIFQPLFSAKSDAKKAAEAEEKGEVFKVGRRYYQLAMLFALEDCTKERDVKRRTSAPRRKSLEAVADFFTAAPAAPTPAAMEGEQSMLAL